MGIKELLRFMKPFIHPIHIQKFKGRRVGIDAYSWLHKGAYACSMEICMNQSWNDARAPFVQYFMHRINLLRHHEIVPVVIFDGGCIPCKSATELERQRRRATNLSLAKEKLSQDDVPAAIEFFQKAVSITPSTAYQLIQILKTEKVEFIVAPYEADAQLAYLSKLEEVEGGISAVITEDSDLLAYGCRAVIFKMDRYGNGEEILMDGVLNSNACGLSFRNFDQDLFTGMCVLAGCDFLPSVPGIGIKKAHLLASKYRNLDRILSVLKFEKSRQMPEGYAEAFREATAVFQHATIYDSKRKVLMPMNELPEKLLEVLDNDVKFLGPMLDPSTAVAIAEGHINPITFEAFCSCAPHINVDEKLSSFTIFSAKEMRIDASTDVERGTEEASYEENDNPDYHDDERFVREAAALGSLYAANSAAKSSQILMENKVVAFPDNNPFSNKKRKNCDGVADERFTECKVSVVLGDLSCISNNEDGGDGGCGGCSTGINALGSPCATNSAGKTSQILMKEKTLSFPNNNPFSNNRKRKKGDDGASKKSGGEVGAVLNGSLSCITSNEDSGNGGAGAGCNGDGLDALGSLSAANAAVEGSQITTKGKPVGCLDEKLFRNKKRKKGDHGTDENFTESEEKIVLREPLSCVTSDEDSGGRRGSGGDGLVNGALGSDSQKSVNSRPAKTSTKSRRSRKAVSGKDGGILKFFTRL